MATVSALATKVITRKGWARVTTQEQSRIEEAVAAAVHRANDDGLPGTAWESFSGETYGNLTLSDFTHVAKASTGTTTDALDNVLPGDIIEHSSTKRVIRHVDLSGTPGVIHLGASVQVQLATAATVYRRSVVLPTSGKVSRVWADGKYIKPTRNDTPMNDTGTAQYWKQLWDDVEGRSYLQLIPAPTKVTELVITQAADLGVLSTSTELDWPESLLDLIVQHAITILNSWQPTEQLEAVLADKGRADASSARDAGGTRGPFGA